MAFGVFDVKMQFLSRKKPIFCDFWPFLVIFEFELMPAGASLWYSVFNCTRTDLYELSACTVALKRAVPFK